MRQKDASFALISYKDKILLFHRDNIPSIPHSDCWQLPGGEIEKGETPEEGMRRELREEVSYVPKGLEFLGEIQRETHKVYFYGAFIDSNKAKLFRKGESEGQEIGFFVLDQILNLQLTPALKVLFSNTLHELKKHLKVRNLKSFFEKHKGLEIAPTNQYNILRGEKT